MKNKYTAFAIVILLGIATYAWAQTPIPVVAVDEVKPFKADVVVVTQLNAAERPIHLRHSKLQFVAGTWFVVGVQTAPQEKRDRLFENPLYWIPMNTVSTIAEIQSATTLPK